MNTIQIPLELTFRGLEPDPQLEDQIRRKSDHLEKFCDHITSCRVAIEKPHEYARSGNPFRVRIDLTVPPGHELVVRKEPGDHELHDNLETVVNSAFQAAERQLKELNQRQRGEVKSHPQPIGFVVRLFAEPGYGFIKTEESDREIYFHRNAVVNSDWERLTIGTQVRFVATMGEEGPQASTLQIIDKPGERSAGGSREVATAKPPLGWEASRRENGG